MKKVSYVKEGIYFREYFGATEYNLRPIKTVKIFMKAKHIVGGVDLYKQYRNSLFFSTKREILKYVNNILTMDIPREEKISKLTVFLLPVHSKDSVLLNEACNYVSIKDEEEREITLIFYLDN